MVPLVRNQTWPSFHFPPYGNGNLNNFVSERGMICRATSLHLVWVKYVTKTEALTSFSHFSVTSQGRSSGWTWTQTCATCLIPSQGATRTSTAPTSPPKCSPTASTIQAGENARPPGLWPALKPGWHSGRREKEIGPGAEHPGEVCEAVPLKSHRLLTSASTHPLSY